MTDLEKLKKVFKELGVNHYSPEETEESVIDERLVHIENGCPGIQTLFTFNGKGKFLEYCVYKRLKKFECAEHQVDELLKKGKEKIEQRKLKNPELLVKENG